MKPSACELKRFVLIEHRQRPLERYLRLVAADAPRLELT